MAHPGVPRDPVRGHTRQPQVTAHGRRFRHPQGRGHVSNVPNGHTNDRTSRLGRADRRDRWRALARAIAADFAGEAHR